MSTVQCNLHNNLQQIKSLQLLCGQWIIHKQRMRLQFPVYWERCFLKGQMRKQIQCCLKDQMREAIAMVSERSDEAITMASERSNKEGITMFSAKLDEEAFEPLVEQGEMPSIPTEEELIKYPELEYSSREVQSIVNKMDKAQKQEFCEYEQYFLTRYRQTGNMQPLYLEIRNIVKEMCPSMPGQMQDAVVEARAQLLAETKLKELCQTAWCSSTVV